MGQFFLTLHQALQQFASFKTLRGLNASSLPKLVDAKLPTYERYARFILKWYMHTQDMVCNLVVGSLGSKQLSTIASNTKLYLFKSSDILQHTTLNTITDRMFLFKRPPALYRYTLAAAG